LPAIGDQKAIVLPITAHRWPIAESPVLLHVGDPLDCDQDSEAFRSLIAVDRSPNPSFAGLVALARRSDPIPSRTRPSNASAPMVLCLKTWESRSSPGLQRTDADKTDAEGRRTKKRPRCRPSRFLFTRRTSDRERARSPSSVLRSAAGWSSPVARQAHNLKAAGSNPAPATSVTCRAPGPKGRGLFSLSQRSVSFSTFRR
jgi:hypothetical protein